MAKKSIDVVIFVMPWEIHAYRNTLNRIETGLTNDPDLRISLYSCLCLSNDVVDWSQSEIKPQRLVKEFNLINSTTRLVAHKDSMISFNEEFSGCVDWRRHHAKICEPGKAVIWLDCDLVFPDTALTAVRQCIENLEDEHCIITPQIPRMWDETWDCLVHKDFQTEETGHCYDFDTSKIDDYAEKHHNWHIKKISPFKFAGGWLTVISSDLLKLARIPDSFKSYGEEDTYLMEVCDGLLKQGWSITQYVIENLLVAQNYELFDTHILQLKIINNKTGDAAYNKSIRVAAVCDSLARIGHPAKRLGGG